MKIQDFYNTTPADIEPGDVFVITLTCHISHITEDGDVYVNVYRCPWPRPQISMEGIPQGDNVKDSVKVAGELFPILGYFPGEIKSF